MTTVASRRVKQPEHPKLLQILGPGLITGASDDDPSGIATYSQVGAQFGYGLTWTLLFSYPLMCAIQEISARIGRVTGAGIAGNLRKHYPAWLLNSIVALLIVANTINLGADLGAMGAALKLLIGGPQLLYVALFAVVSALLEIFLRYSRYVSVAQMADAVLVRLCGDGLCRPCAVGRSRPLARCAGAVGQNRLHRRSRRGARHDDQPLPVLLASGRRGRGRAGAPRGQAAQTSAATGAR